MVTTFTKNSSNWTFKISALYVSHASVFKNTDKVDCPWFFITRDGGKRSRGQAELSMLFCSLETPPNARCTIFYELLRKRKQCQLN